MVIQCENCRRKYRLDDSRIEPPGSSVRCSKCGHIFFISKAVDSHDEEKFGLSQETPLSEDLKEEITGDEKSNESLEMQEAVSETSSDLAQGELTINEENNETENDMVDLPTEHEDNLEDFIDKDITENTAADIQSEELLIKEEEIDNKTETSDMEENDESIQNSPELFDIDDNDNMNADIGEAYTDQSFEEDYTDELTTQNIDSISLDKETPIIENINQEDFDGREKEISENTSNGKITKSSTGIVARFIYTLVTIAALFVIFIASLVILINAEILPMGTLSSLTAFVEAIVPLELNKNESPKIIISEHKARWMNTVNGPVYIVSGLITNESQAPVHYVKLRSEYIAAEKKQFEDTFYAGNTFTDLELKVSPIEKTLSKLDQKNGDINVNNSRKLAGLNYNIQPGESIPFFTVFPADGRVLGLRYNLEVIDYKEASSN